jgi:mRNA interferase MazF
MIKHSVVLVPFPFDDFSATKVRPALCLTGEIGRFGHVIIAFISSRMPDDLHSDPQRVFAMERDWTRRGFSHPIAQSRYDST